MIEKKIDANSRHFDRVYSIFYSTHYDRVYLPQICNKKTLSIKAKLMTRTGTGPILIPGLSSV